MAGLNRENVTPIFGVSGNLVSSEPKENMQVWLTINHKMKKEKARRSFKSPRVSCIILDPDFIPTESSSPHPNSDFILPFLKLFKWTLAVPNDFCYDQDRLCFYSKKGSRLWKSLSFIWLALMAAYMSIVCFTLNSTEKRTIKAYTAKMTWVSYTVFDITIINSLRRNGDKIAKLLSEANRISHWCDSLIKNDFKRFQRKKKTIFIKYLAILACIFSVVYTILFVWFVITELTDITTSFYITIKELSISEKNPWACQTVRCQLAEICRARPLACVPLTLWMVMAVGVEVLWVIFLFMTTFFAYYIERLLHNCVCIIKNNYGDTCENLRVFTKISILLEDFNALFGGALLWIVIAIVMYTSLTFGELLNGFKNETAYDFLNILGLLPFVLVLYTGSELHRTGQVLPSIMKRKYFDMDISFRDDTHLFQMIQGTNIIHHDALSNTIGLKGHGFFTISYRFVTSLVGVTLTYTLLAFQMKLNDVPIWFGN